MGLTTWTRATSCEVSASTAASSPPDCGQRRAARSRLSPAAFQSLCGKASPRGFVAQVVNLEEHRTASVEEFKALLFLEDPLDTLCKPVFRSTEKLLYALADVLDDFLGSLRCADSRQQRGKSKVDQDSLDA